MHQNLLKDYTKFFTKLFRHTGESISLNWAPPMPWPSAVVYPSHSTLFSLLALGSSWVPQYPDTPSAPHPSRFLSRHSDLPVSWQSSQVSCTLSAHSLLTPDADLCSSTCFPLPQVFLLMCWVAWEAQLTGF